MDAPRRARARGARLRRPRAVSGALALLLSCAGPAAAQGGTHTASASRAPGGAPPGLVGPAGAPPDTLLSSERIEARLRALEARLDGEPEAFDARWQAARDAVWLGILASGTDEENRWFRRGLGHAERALAQRPDDPEALRWALAAKGNLAVQTGMTESARLGAEVWDLAQRVLRLDPTAAHAHYALGKLEYELLKLNRVQRLMSRPFRHGALTRLSWADALAYAERAVELDPNASLYRLGLADTLWRLDRRAEAGAQLEIAKDLPLRAPADRDFRDRAVLLLDRIGKGMDPTK